MAKKKSTNSPTSIKTLRERAEEIVRKTRTDIARMTTEDVQLLVHELQVHQIELQLQNEELLETQVALSESRDRFADLYEFAPVGYVTLDQDGRVLDANLTAATMLGAERKSLSNANLTKFVTPESQDTFYFHRQAVFSVARLTNRETEDKPDAALDRVPTTSTDPRVLANAATAEGEDETEAKQSCEIGMRRADGTRFMVRLESVVFHPPHADRCRTALIDVTARKRAEDELRKLNDSLAQQVADQTHDVRLLAEAVANLAEGVVITDDELDWPGPRIRFVNEAACRITGYAADELIGKTPRVLQGKQSDRAALDRLKSELAAGRPHRCELVNYRKDGTPYDAELFITPLFDANGRRTNFVSIHHDITERKQTEQALREREERLRAVLNTAADAIVTINRHGIIVSVNPTTERMFGYSHDELIGQNVKLLMPPPYCDEHDGYLAHFLETRQARIIGIGREALGRRKDGSTFPVDLTVSEINHQQHFTGIIRDLSERTELRTHVLEIAAEEQRRIGQELHDGTQQELTALELIAGTVMDRLKSIPEQTSAGQSVWLLDKPSYTRLIETAMKLSQRLADAARHVQQLARGIMPVQIDADGLRSALAELAASTNGLKGITCLFDCPDPVSLADNTTATHLYRIAQEAVNNALRHGRATEIVISFALQDGQLRLEVRDNGIGFDAAAVRPDSVGQSHGMGLRTMEYRASLIGGTLRLERGANGGTTVRCVVLGGG